MQRGAGSSFVLCCASNTCLMHLACPWPGKGCQAAALSVPPLWHQAPRQKGLGIDLTLGRGELDADLLPPAATGEAAGFLKTQPATPCGSGC